VGFPILEKYGTGKPVAYGLLAPFSGVVTKRFTFGECVSTFGCFRSVHRRFWSLFGTCYRTLTFQALRNAPRGLRRVYEVVGSVRRSIVLVDAVKESELCLGVILYHGIHVAWLHVITQCNGENAKGIDDAVPVP
jgi:hypothetical protein